MQEHPCYITLKGYSTVSRCLNKEFGMESHRSPHLILVMKKIILDFSRRHRYWTLTKLKKVLFSDECTMQEFVLRQMQIGGLWVIATKKHPPSQMKWGDMSCHGAAGPYFVQPNMDPNTWNCMFTAARSSGKMALLITDQR